MASSRLSDFYYEKKRIAHRPGLKQGSGSTSKVSVEEQRNRELQTLKDFDLNQDYGPCIGITRLERWERAQRHDLKPSLEVRDLILLHSTDKEYTESVWYTYSAVL